MKLKRLISIIAIVAIMFSSFVLVQANAETSKVIDWENGDTSIVSSSTGVVTGKISSAMTIDGSTKALEISSSNWDETTGSNYVKISLDKTTVENSRDIKVNIGSNSTTGNKAHFGIIMNGTVYWDFAYMGGSVPQNNYEEVSLLNKSFVSLKDNEFKSNGAYDTQVTVKSTNISKITAIVVSPANNSTVQKVYVDDITFVDKEDIPTVSMPSKGAVFCNWKGTVNFVKTDGWDGHSTNLSEMPNAYNVSGGMLNLNTQGYSYDSLMVQTEVTLDTTQTANAIAAAQESDGYLYMSIRFNSAYNAKGNDCAAKFKIYCFANGDWQNAKYMVGEYDAITNTVGEQLIKYPVDAFEGMIPDTIAIIVMNGSYYHGLSAINIGFSDIYATSGVTATSPNTTTKTTTTTKTNTTTTTNKATTTTSNTNVSGKLYGDCNSDGSVNGKDVLLLRKYIVKLANVIDTGVSDLNSDGNINGKDVLLLRKYIVGLIDRFPIQNTQSPTTSTTAPTAAPTKTTTKTNTTTTTKTTTTTTKSTTTTTKTTTKTTTTTTTKNPSSSGGTTSNMRDITATALVGEMTVGINIGDTLDSVGSGVWQETSWGNPKITKQLIQSIKAAGFNTIRLPVTWRNNIDSNNQINESFLNRVQEVVDYIMNEGMYCIINTHHEQNWLNTNSSAMESRKVKFAAVWNQLANRFKNYNEHLIFEGYNEILKSEGDWSSPSSTDLANANALAQVFVNTVRATGGNNAIRVLIINTYGALANTTAINGLTMPTDTVANKLAVEIHTYDPQSFCFLNNSDDTWGTIADKNEIDNILIRVYNKFVSKGIPAIVGEFGAVNKNNTSARAAYCSYMVSQAKSKGIKCIYWDNGHTGVASDTDTYGLFNRSTGAQVHSEIINALVNAAK